MLAIAYTLFAIGSYLIGYFSNSGPLNYVFFVIAGFPWTQILSRFIARESGGSIIYAFVGVLINLSLVWWWASRGRQSSGKTV